MTTEIFKIVLIGESGVGKTSIIKQFIDQTFQEDIQSSVGGSFCSKNLIYDNNKLLKLEIWDTAGQERYRSLTRMFYSDANACILVYDITRKASFEELKNYLIEQVKERTGDKIILAIAANKSDLIESEEVDEEEARDLATSLGAIFSSISAKYISGINDLFIEIAKKYLGVEDVRIESDDIKNSKGSEGDNSKKDGKIKLEHTQTEVQKDKNKKKCC